mmetsp:Transcript_26473/g.32191  ORF Transcript_26473/g.32191 Transcript_26473/m.32191 type:complete len:189 (-) Transcript_26473:127-693(-)
MSLMDVLPLELIDMIHGFAYYKCKSCKTYMHNNIYNSCQSCPNKICKKCHDNFKIIFKRSNDDYISIHLCYQCLNGINTIKCDYCNSLWTNNDIKSIRDLDNNKKNVCYKCVNADDLYHFCLTINSRYNNVIWYQHECPKIDYWSQNERHYCHDCGWSRNPMFKINVDSDIQYYCINCITLGYDLFNQ